MTRPLRLVQLACLLLPLILAGCLNSKAPPSRGASHSISIMTFNVENLFDNEDDPDRDDRTYLRIEDKQSAAHKNACAKVELEYWRTQCLDWDWNDDIVERKLQAVSSAILQVNGGLGADIVALQEVEHLSILERLRQDYLGKAGYLHAILIEGQDERGIDVAFLSKLPLAAEPVLHEMRFAAEFDARVADTRGILQADFILPDGNTLTGFAVHFPAPYHPTEMRVTAYELLNRLRASLPDRRSAFAAGDFNTTSSEDASEAMFERLVRPRWVVAHDYPCGGCRGSNYYAPQDSWSFLDTILWSPATDRGENATWGLRKDSVAMANEVPAQASENGTPARFSLPDGSGVSDHWPLVVTIESK